MHVVHPNSSLSGSGECYDVNIYLCLHESLQNHDSSLNGVRQQMGIGENKRVICAWIFILNLWEK